MTATVTLSGGMVLRLTYERRRRIELGIVEAQDKLEKELEYSEDLQHKDMIGFYRRHIEKLSAMLN